ncbi:MAG: hypothetical protein VB089_02550 [Anaerolineaceae bacterium]|nr:hypothetical protein [Anaerolineaceae bacterium]
MYNDRALRSFSNHLRKYAGLFWNEKTQVYIISIWTALPLVVARFLPVYDYPQWVYQAHVISNFNYFRDFFDIRWIPVPNLGSTLLLSIPALIFGAESGAKILLVLNVLLFITGYSYFTLGVHGRLQNLKYLGPIFVYNYFFYEGFLSFYLGLTVLLWVFGYMLRISSWENWRQILILSIFSTLGYFLHLFIWLPIALYVLLQILLCRLPAKVLASQIPPLALVSIYSLYRAGNSDIHLQLYVSVLNKLFSIVGPILPFQRVDPFPSIIPVLFTNLLAVLFVGFILLRQLKIQKRNWRIDINVLQNRTLWVTCGFLFLIGIAIPFTWFAGMGNLDQRFVFIAFLLGLPLILSLLKLDINKGLAITTSVIFIILHTSIFLSVDGQLKAIHQTLKTIPTDSSIYVGLFRDYPVYGECMPHLANYGNGIFSLQWFPLYYAVEQKTTIASTFNTAILRLKPETEPQMIFGEYIAQEDRDQLVQKIDTGQINEDLLLIFKCPNVSIENEIKTQYNLFASGNYFDLFTHNQYSNPH